MNKKGSFISLFVMIIVVFVVIMFSVVMIYVGNTTYDKLHETLDPIADSEVFGNQNASQVIDDTFGAVNTSYSHLHWIVVMLIFGMALSILYGSYKVRTQPIYFLPYILITAVAIIVSVGLANAYETIIQNAVLSGTFAGFVGGNHFFLNLPVYIGIIGFAGGIIMFVSWATRPEDQGGYAYYGY